MDTQPGQVPCLFHALSIPRERTSIYNFHRLVPKKKKHIKPQQFIRCLPSSPAAQPGTKSGQKQPLLIPSVALQVLPCIAARYLYCGLQRGRGPPKIPPLTKPRLTKKHARPLLNGPHSVHPLFRSLHLLSPIPSSHLFPLELSKLVCVCRDTWKKELVFCWLFFLPPFFLSFFISTASFFFFFFLLFFSNISSPRYPLAFLPPSPHLSIC